ncbi:hypothetical protein RB195_003533 [Necator americanus]|uniref:Uncharacterized protein n=1 Tax=Necator americanus TaxID=51031 RepID=A0ABR1DP12_NECAM
MPTATTSLLIIAVLTVIIFLVSSNSECIVDAAVYQRLIDSNKTLLHCVVSKYTKTSDSCTVSDLKEGYTQLTTTGCRIHNISLECYCSDRCPETELDELTNFYLANGETWERSCIESFVNSWKKTERTDPKIPSTILPVNVSDSTKTVTETSRKSSLLTTREATPQIDLTSEAMNTSYSNLTSEEEGRLFRKQLLKATTFKLFWIFSTMTFLMLCQMILISMIRFESINYFRESSSHSSSITLVAERTNTPTTVSRNAASRMSSSKQVPRAKKSIDDIPRFALLLIAVCMHDKREGYDMKVYFFRILERLTRISEE